MDNGFLKVTAVATGEKGSSAIAIMYVQRVRAWHVGSSRFPLSHCLFIIALLLVTIAHTHSCLHVLPNRPRLPRHRAHAC